MGTTATQGQIDTVLSQIFLDTRKSKWRFSHEREADENDDYRARRLVLGQALAEQLRARFLGQHRIGKKKNFASMATDASLYARVF
jgi:hypothetical protein